MFAFMNRPAVNGLCGKLLRRGILVQGPPEWHPAPAELKEACRAAGQYAQEQGSSIATLAIKSALQNPAIQSHLVGFSKPEQVGVGTACSAVHACGM